MTTESKDTVDHPWTPHINLKDEEAAWCTECNEPKEKHPNE